MKNIFNFIKKEYVIIISTLAIIFTIYFITKDKVSFEVGFTTLIAFEVFIDKIDKKLKREIRNYKRKNNKPKTDE
jgi:hypothetical protein